LEWAFPKVNAGQTPLGGRVIVQLRRIKKKAGMIIIVDETTGQTAGAGMLLSPRT
jgi:sulfate adenylyltransferase subunit 1 (EFTu-like GTPase family)